ncbi:ABC transporter like [Heracleum sosnowskyi]|uniref:ABC transporter like n=1 Tax=Heracleum sosnowskyi TaxID=360622 RepID=A0AAD8HK13_9APIA|nr:ABC transporter like [Heracleum sosnowskyi]
MSFQKESLDLVFVPSGLVLMFGYHLILLYRCLKLPHTTVIGFENNDKKAWVESIMQEGDHNKNGSMALSVIASNVSAATFLSSVSLTLSSIIGAILTSNSNILESNFIYGDTRPATISIKYTCLLLCFLLAFSCFIQSSRCFIHATYLITIPNSNITAKQVEITVIRAGDFWSFGLRSLYFALTLLLWFFGPIPMFVSSVVMVLLLHYLDTNTTPLHQHAKQPAKHPMIG